MATELLVPEVGESITSGVIATWLKDEGTYVERDEPVLELETDKVTQELVAPASGVLKHLAAPGDEVEVGTVIGSVDEAAKKPAGAPAASAPESTASEAPAEPATPSSASNGDVRATPLAKKLAAERGVDLTSLQGSGAGGRIREQDVLSATPAPAKAPAPAAAPAAAPAFAGDRTVRRERMTPLRQRIAARLVEAQHNAAMLTTFNECDMSRVMELRKTYKDSFKEQHDVSLGFMSFFVKATVNALQQFPAINASIVDGADGAPEIEFHDYADVSVAVTTPKGLVVPVLRNCEKRSFAGIESGIKDLAIRGRDGKLGLDELQGGTFTITNGGIFGSLMSTPILNPPQTGILGMHTIKQRAAEDPDNPGQVAIRPMMYLALSYDHRLVDGAEAVRFLVSIKESIEAPERLLFDLA